jgi:phage head maturation protease
LPIPQPNEGESEQGFVSRCMGNENMQEYDQKQRAAICYNSYREHHEKNKNDIYQRLIQLKNKLVQVFGDMGLKYFQYTLSRMGVSETKKGDFDYHGQIDWLPFIKEEENGKVEFCNIPLAEMPFDKTNKQDHTVEGYASVFICDCDDDLIPPEAYSKSVEEYRQTPVVYFSHQPRQPPFGTFPEDRIDDIGWWVKTKVAKNPSLYWEMVEDGRLNGYSIGGSFRIAPEMRGNVKAWKVDSVHISDLSAVPRPCNKLSFWSLFKKADRNFEVTHEGVIIHVNDLDDSVLTLNSEAPIFSVSGINNWQNSTSKEAKKMREFDDKGFAKDLTTEQRESLSTEQFACPSQRKLPIHDADHVRNAMARFNQTEGCQTPEVKARICRAAKHFGIESTEFCGQEKDESNQNGGNNCMSEQSTQQEPKGTTETKDYSKMKFEELVAELRKKEQEKIRAEMIGELTLSDEKLAKKKEDERIYQLNKAIGEIIVRLDKIEQTTPKLDDLSQRLTKMEELPIRPAKSATEETLEDKAMKVYHDAGGGEMGIAALNRMKNRMEKEAPKA